MRIPASFSSCVSIAAVLAALSACAGKSVSLGTNESPLELVAPSAVSGTVSACAAGDAHPNVCCQASAGSSSQCGVYPDAPFHPCESGWTTYPDPRSCCPLDGAGNCVAPPPNNPPPPTVTCSYACSPGWYPITNGCCQEDPSGNGGVCYGWASPPTSVDGGVVDAGEIDAEPGDGGVIVEDGGAAPDAGDPFPDAGEIDAEADAGADDGGVSTCAVGPNGADACVPDPVPTPVAPPCNAACPAGWQSAEGSPDVCCREVGPNEFECFSQATGPVAPSPGPTPIAEDAGEAPDAGVIGVSDAGAPSH